MDEDRQLLGLWEQNICPYCGRTIPEGTRVGSGRKAEGEFCSLDCYAQFYALDLRSLAIRVQEISSRHRES